MDKLKAMNTFVAIVDQGSLSAAGNKLDRSPAAIVRTLAGLERHLGMRLLNRSTRRLALTDEGRDYLQHCRQILADIQGAEARLDSRRTEPAGTLSITAPVMFGHQHLTPLLNQWLKQHPQMRAELTLLDRVTDLLEEGFDLALRIGHLADSTLIARPLGHTGYVLCASPELLEQRGHPSHPQDLADWPTVCFAPAGSTWHFQVDGKPWSQRIDPLIRANQIDTQLAADARAVRVPAQPAALAAGAAFYGGGGGAVEGKVGGRGRRRGLAVKRFDFESAQTVSRLARGFGSSIAEQGRYPRWVSNYPEWVFRRIGGSA